MLAVAISLAASLCWGSTDFLSGLASRRAGVPVVLLVVEGVGLMLVVAFALVVAEPLPDAGVLAQATAAGVSGVTGLGLFFWALTLGKMSVVAPIAACGAVLPAVVGLATGDPFSGVLAAGLVCALLGIVLVSLEAEHEEELRGGPAARRAIALALIAAVGMGGYYVLFDGVADESLPWGLAAARAVPVLGLAGIVVVRRLSRPDASARSLAVGAGVLDVSATALYGVALTKGSLSVVSVVGSLFPLTTVVLARLLLGERLRRVQRVGIAFALVGVALIAGA
ncbi:MAG TPA: EamA family transporter [Solirubrobacteraceae bacterium]|nr:EamA family transporter [Solirubrobacteraceae bacterium]HSD82097.1 EamA family transporter [Solirubrobacteraceae bacterium]